MTLSPPFAAGLALALLVPLAACGTGRFRFIDQGDRPPGDDMGLPPPAAEVFEPCTHVGHRVESLDTNGDGKVDTLRVLSPSGVEVCRGSDLDFNGKLDTWDVIKEGKVTHRAHDSDGNGKVDQAWTFPNPLRPGCGVIHPDRDGDGRPDPGMPKVDLCAMLDEMAPGVVPTAPSLPPPLVPRAQ